MNNSRGRNLSGVSSGLPITNMIASKGQIKRLIEQRLGIGTAIASKIPQSKLISSNASKPMSKSRSTSQSQSQAKIVVRNSGKLDDTNKMRHLRTNSLKVLSRQPDATFQQKFKDIKQELLNETTNKVVINATEERYKTLMKQFSIERSKVSKKPIQQIKAYGANTHQGLIRNYNEDRVCIVTHFGHDNSLSFFAVYDGHGGNLCADYLRDNLHKLLCAEPTLKTDVKQALRSSILKAEQNVLKNSQANNDFSGSCALIVIIQGNKIYVANVGDCRAILSQENGMKVRQLTNDHKPNDPAEHLRIVKAGGSIYQNKFAPEGISNPYRVLPGRLSVSRTIGDLQAKSEKYNGNPQVVIADPQIEEYEITSSADFIFLASDGIYDKLTNEDVCRIMHKTRNEYRSQDTNALIGRSIQDVFIEAFTRQTTDNISAIVIAFQQFEISNDAQLLMPIKHSLQKKALTNRTHRNVSNLASFKRLQTVRQVLHRASSTPSKQK